MKFPVIRIKQKNSNSTHIVGSNSHDTLHINPVTGEISYLNLQCCAGTGGIRKDDATYKFIGIDDEFSPYEEIEFLSFDELVKMYAEYLEEAGANEAEIQMVLKSIIEMNDKKNEVIKKYNLDNENNIIHTVGNRL